MVLFRRTHQKLMACFQILSKQYLENLDDSFKIEMFRSNEYVRRKSFSRYQSIDKVGEICIPSINYKEKFDKYYV